MAGMVVGGIVGLMLGLLLIHIVAPDTPAILLLAIPLGSLVFGRNSSARYRKHGATYALTDRRVFAVSKLYRTVKCTTLPLEHLAMVQVDKRDYNRHTLHFFARSAVGFPASTPSLRFRLISDTYGLVPHLQQIKPDVVVKPVEEVPRPPSE